MKTIELHEIPTNFPQTPVCRWKTRFFVMFVGNFTHSDFFVGKEKSANPLPGPQTLIFGKIFGKIFSVRFY